VSEHSISVRETELLVWRYEVTVSFEKGMPSTLFKMRNEINDWLDYHRIKYQYTKGYTWHLKRAEDITLFVLRWS
jgi:hypothetical protein